MILSTLCYLQQEDQYLMLHRVKKKNDMNQDKWIGIGGKLEAGESPEECLLREAREETGLQLTDYRFRGIVTFVSDQWDTEYMFLYTATGFAGEMKVCDEGDLEWVPFDKIASPIATEHDEKTEIIVSVEAIFILPILLRSTAKIIAYSAMS